MAHVLSRWSLKLALGRRVVQAERNNVPLIQPVSRGERRDVSVRGVQLVEGLREVELGEVRGAVQLVQQLLDARQGKRVSEETSIDGAVIDDHAELVRILFHHEKK